MEHQQTSPHAPALSSVEGPASVRTLRHDGWTGEKMATFCETLAETAVVAEACHGAGMSVGGAYALRRRSPFFAAAWDAALTSARERLADTLLARSMEGNVEQIWRDGEVVGERHLLDNRLGLAILRRLDRLAETGLSLHTNPPSLRSHDRGPAEVKPQSPTILHRSQAFAWEMMVDALRTEDPDAIAQALAVAQGDKVEEVEDPLNRPPSPEGDEPETLDLSDRCWKERGDGDWLTDFPPPGGFSGYESRPYGEANARQDYERACTAEEIAILEADAAAGRAEQRAEEEELRDAWFAMLRSELAGECEEAADEQPDSGALGSHLPCEPSPEPER